mmetsp:Transcript_56080/g.87294  ORF Transcript_56080/g.87294 Transcript_56080/m.87294 type:complete len:92 (+) Transcript_56080:602-877(+)
MKLNLARELLQQGWTLADEPVPKVSRDTLAEACNIATTKADLGVDKMLTGDPYRYCESRTIIEALFLSDARLVVMMGLSLCMCMRLGCMLI